MPESPRKRPAAGRTADPEDGSAAAKASAAKASAAEPAAKATKAAEPVTAEPKATRAAKKAATAEPVVAAAEPGALAEAAAPAKKAGKAAKKAAAAPVEPPAGAQAQEPQAGDEDEPEFLNRAARRAKGRKSNSPQPVSGKGVSFGGRGSAPGQQRQYGNRRTGG